MRAVQLYGKENMRINNILVCGPSIGHEKNRRMKAKN